VGPVHALAVSEAAAGGLSGLRRAAAILLAGALLALVAGGCTLRNGSKSLPPPANTDTTPDTGGIGTPVTVRGSRTELEVRVTRLIDPVAGGSADTTLEPGARFVGVELALRNIGRGTYAESPGEDSKLLLAGGSEAAGVNLLGGECGGDFPLLVVLKPGDRARGCVPFEVSRGGRPDRFQFALDSGFGTEVGTWRLRG
jgi:hypothetical protein